MRRSLLILLVAVMAMVLTTGESAVVVRAREVRRAHAQSVPVTLTPPASIALTGPWLYRPDPHNIGVSQNWGQGGAPAAGWTPVSIPNDFNPTVSPASDAGAVAWYETSFTGPTITAGRSWGVHFEGVRRNAQVWLNGDQVGGSSDPYVPFQVPTTTLRAAHSNLLIVRVDNYRGAGSFPEDWWNWGGITGPVTLEPVGQLSVEHLGAMPRLGCSLRCGQLLVQGTVANHTPADLRPVVFVDVTNPGGGLNVHWHTAVGSVGSGNSIPLSLNVPLKGIPKLWSPGSPSLYDVQVSITVGRRIEQVTKLRVGMRTARVRNGIVYLNGHRLWLHGAAIHEDMSGAGAALTDGDIDTIVSELRSVGANVTRTHYLLSERLLNALDTAGIMVWEQPPIDHADRLLRSASGRSQALSMLRSTILGDRSHPSVIFNSVGNELSSTPDTAGGTRSYLNQAITLARRLDPAALISLDTYCYPGYPAQKLYRQLDVLGIDSYFGWYTGPSRHSINSLRGLKPFLTLSHSRYPHQALVVSEFGAEGIYNGPATVKGTFAFQSNYLAQTYAIINQLPFVNGSIYWTLREFAVQPGWTGGAVLPAGDVPDGLHHKGLITYDGAEKPAFAVAQKLLAQIPSFVH